MATAGRIIMTKGTAPATPISGKSVLYCKDDGKYYCKSNDGIEHMVSLPDVGVSLSYPSTDKPGSNAEVSVLLPYALTFLTDLVGSTYYAATAPSTTVTISIMHNGVQFGTLTVTTSNTPTFTATQTSCSEGARISFVFGTQDSSWAGVAITLKGVR